jgi:hypothetical protein
MGVVNVSKPDLFKQPKIAWLEKARAEARKLLERKEYITSEEVTEVCPLPRYLHRNTIGGIFQHPDFQVVGVTFARRPSSNSRLIRKWALRNPVVPRKAFSNVEYDRGD